MMKTLLHKFKTLWLVSVGLLLIWTTSYSGNIHVPGSVTLPRSETLEHSILLESKKTSSPGKGLLLFAYMRSGSTVTGNLLRDSSGVFFMFEPLSPLAPYHYFTDKSICQMRNESCRSGNVKAQIEEALTTLIHLYSCNMEAVPIQVLNKMVEENKSGRPWVEFGKCLNRTKSLDQNHGENTVKSDCFMQLEKVCRAAEVRVAKVLRLSFTTIQTLLESLPKLKILFLARDPRAIINSRIETTWFPVFGEKPQTVLKNSLSLCLKMETDIRAWKKISNVYGDRILHKTLMQISSRIGAMLDIFKFLNKTATLFEERNMISYLCKNLENNITGHWRSELSLPYRRHVEKHCDYVIQHLTYVDRTVDRF